MLEPRAKEEAEKKKPTGCFVNILSQDLAPSVTSKQNMHMHSIK